MSSIRREQPRHTVRVFIGSSSSSLELARQLQIALDVTAPEADVTVWDEAFRPGQLLLDKIVRLVKHYDFGIFVFAADDVQLIQGHQAADGKTAGLGPSTVMTVRDNVLFEAGVFMGGLGHERTFLVVPRGPGSGLKKVIDLEGLLTANYRITDKGDNEGGPGADVKAAAKQIAAAIRDLGPAPRSEYDELLALRKTLDECEFKDHKGHTVVLGDLLKFAAHTRALKWHQGVEPKDLMAPIHKKWGNVAADDAYWWLVVHGVFRFAGIDHFTSSKGWKWKHSIEYVAFSARGAALLNELQTPKKVNGERDA